MTDIKKFIRNIPDFPKKGIIFRDISTLFLEPNGLKLAVDLLYEICKKQDVDKFAAMDARGFLIAAPLAYKMSKGIVMVRKKGKLPCDTISVPYQLEYGEAEVEIHRDSILPGENVILIDDLIATGGTAEAGVKLLKALGAKISLSCFIINLPDLGGSSKLEQVGVQCKSLVSYDGH